MQGAVEGLLSMLQSDTLGVNIQSELVYSDFNLRLYQLELCHYVTDCMSKIGFVLIGASCMKQN